MIISCSESLVVHWAKDLYTVNKRTLWKDSQRRCWICHGPFVVGDGVTVANTDEGNKTVHTRCYKEQEREGHND